jgi:hypothetical protein
VSVRELLVGGVGVNVGVTIAVSEPGRNSTDIGATTAPLTTSPLQAMVTLSDAVVSPDRVRENCGGVIVGTGGQKRIEPSLPLVTVTVGSVCAPLGPPGNTNAPTTTAIAARGRRRIAEH